MSPTFSRGAPLLAAVLCLSCSSSGGAKREGPPLFDGRKVDHALPASAVSARIEVARDEYGIPHIFAHTLEDAAFGEGYAHARDRFFQMDLYRHLVEGRLSEYFGSLTESIDVDNLSNMLTTEGRPVFEAMEDAAEGAELSVSRAYAAGVNLYIERLRRGDVPTPEGYAHPLLAAFETSRIPDWRVADSFAIGRLQEMNLSDSTDTEIAWGEAKQKLPPELFRDLFRKAPPDPIAILPDFYDSPFAPGHGCKTVSGCITTQVAVASSLYRGVDFGRVLARAKRRDIFGMKNLPDAVAGSNNWVVSGDLTDSGRALVLNDPHLRFYLPSLFYYSHQDTAHYGTGAKTASEMGISFPGVPGTLIGHNQHVAWGATTTGWDVADVYVETLNEAGDAALFEGDYVPLLRVTRDILVLGENGVEARPHAFEIVPHHGVIVPGSKENGKALTRKWTGHEPRNGFGALVERHSARNIDDFMEAMSRFVAGAQNWNGADTSGNTGYMPGARVPVRASVTGACDPSLPMDGTGPCEWTGVIPASDMPRVKNRENGYVVTANNDVTGTLADNDPSNDPQYLMSVNADGFRARRITDRIEALKKEGKITRQRMIALQADTVSLEAERLLPFVASAAAAVPALVEELGLADALDRLSRWDRSAPSGVDAAYRKDGGPTEEEVEASIAAAIFHTFRPRFYAALFGDEKTKYEIGFYDTPAALYVLENPTPERLALFDDPSTSEVETRDQVILRSLASALDFLRTKLGPSADAWRWGALHQVEVRDAFGDFGALQRKLGPFPRSGANSTVDVAGTGGATEDFTFTGGPQMRFVAEVGEDGITAASSLPGGQVDASDSAHYDDLLPLWLRNETFPFYFKTSDVVAHTEELTVITPE